MNLQHAPIATAKSTRLRDAGDMGLQGPLFLLARLLWLAIFLLTLVVFCANFLVGGYSLVINMLLVATISLWLAISLVLFWHTSTDRAILLISLVLVLLGKVFFPPIPRALMNDGARSLTVDIMEFLGGFSLIFVYTFPDGHFTPGFTRWVFLLISNRFSCRTRRGKKNETKDVHIGIGVCINGSRTPIGHDKCEMTVQGGLR